MKSRITYPEIMGYDKQNNQVPYSKIAFGMIRVWLYPYMAIIQSNDLLQDLLQDLFLACLIGQKERMSKAEFKKFINQKLYQFKTKQLGLYYEYNGKNNPRKWTFREISLEDLKSKEE